MVVVPNMSQIQEMLGETLGSFRIESVLGAGGMGVVYPAINCAVGLAGCSQDYPCGAHAQGLAETRFMREAKILEQFRHPNIVRLLARGRFRGTTYIAMELVQGLTLEDVLHDGGNLQWRDVVDLAIQVCDD